MGKSLLRLALYSTALLCGFVLLAAILAGFDPDFSLAFPILFVLVLALLALVGRHELAGYAEKVIFWFLFFAEEDRAEQDGPFVVELLNVRKTPPRFVLDILVEVFGKSRRQAYFVEAWTRRQGRGVCGRCAEHEARAKVAEVQRRAEQAGCPLTCVASAADERGKTSA